tara:strand:- start:169 stop:732 length:564 start_codon:yes stop_codon:yes gene_type:complete
MKISKSKGYLIVTAFILAVLTFCTLKTQAQTLCDSNMTYTIGSQYQLEIAVPVTGNGLPMMAPLYVVTYGDQTMLGEDSCFSNACTHIVMNYNPTTGMPYDTITTCISYTLTDTLGYVDTMSCCFNQVWDGQAWMMMSNLGVPTGIDELVIDRFNDNKIYDMFGRELLEAPIGQMYIRNRNVFFIVE